MTVNRIRIQTGDVVKLQLPMWRRISPLRTASVETIEEVYAVVECFDQLCEQVIFRFTKYEFGDTTMMHCRMNYDEVEKQTGRRV